MPFIALGTLPLLRISSALLAFCTLAASAPPAWDRFRGPNGAGVSDATNLPDEIDVGKNLLWKIETPPGFSSPVIANDRLYLTAHEQGNLFTMAIDRNSGKVLWKQAAPKSLDGKPKGPNSPVSPTPVTDGKNVYAFFPNFGLVSYDLAGKERWNFPIEPVNNPYVPGASPILYKDLLLMVVDQDTDSYLLAVQAKDGKVKWKHPRPGVTHSFSTPIVWEPKGQPAQLIVSGSFRVTGYQIQTGEPVWWASGMAWQAKTHPVIGNDTLYIHSWMADLNQLGVKTDPWEQVLAAVDEDKDGKVNAQEGGKISKELQGLFFLFDLNHDKFIDAQEWQMQRDRNTARNGLYAIKMAGAKGDVTETHVKWRYDKSLPNLPSPLLYHGILYVLKEGGILTALSPEDGKVLKQGRVEGAVDSYAASPVAADGKIYLASGKGKIAVLEPGAEWKVKQVHDLKEDLWATPALANGRVYIRTQTALYCFGKV
jgi:outer membrane protein assembly factor BamB